MKNYYKEFMVYSTEDETTLVMYRGIENLSTHQYRIVMVHHVDPYADDYKEVMKIIESYNGQDYFSGILDHLNSEYDRDDEQSGWQWCSTIEEAIEDF